MNNAQYTGDGLTRFTASPAEFLPIERLSIQGYAENHRMPGESSDETGPARHRVLLVEDHAALAAATAEIIRRHGLDVRVATSGRDALEIIEEFDPVIILCDMTLPDMTGLDLVEAVGTRRGADDVLADDVLIAMLTAMSGQQLRGFEGHPNARRVNLFLSKPLTNEKLVGVVSMLEVLRDARRNNDQSVT